MKFSRIRQKFDSLSLDLKNVSSATAYLAAEQSVRTLLGLVIAVYSANYLGPAEFGILALVIAATSLLKPIQSMGLAGIVVREVARSEAYNFTIVYAAIILRVLASVVFLGILTIVAPKVIEELNSTILFVGGLSVTLTLIFEVFLDFFRAKYDLKIPTVLKIGSHITYFFVILSLIYLQFSLIWFIWALVLRSLIFGISISVLFNNKYPLKKDMLPSRHKVVGLARESWPLIFSRGFVMIYLYVDQLMVAAYLGADDAGIYSLAVKMCSPFLMVALLLSKSFQPWLTKVYSNDPQSYLYFSYNWTKYFSIIGSLGTLALIVVGPPVFEYLVSEDFYPAIPIFQIYIISVIFIFSAIPRGIMIIINSDFKILMWINMLASIINLVLNFILIPRVGMAGAAFATVFSYFCGFVLCGMLFQSIRQIAIQQVICILTLGLWGLRSKA